MLWDRATGEPVHQAIVWQDRRTADLCADSRRRARKPWSRPKRACCWTPTFSGTKLKWLLDNVKGARERAVAGELAFGTVDTWLLYKLTDGAVHRTDATNACRTLLFNIHDQTWDDELLDMLDIPRALLPEVCDNASRFWHHQHARCEAPRCP